MIALITWLPWSAPEVQALPPLALIGASAHPVALGSQGITAQLLAHRLPDGAMLVLGHDLRELRDIESTLATASLIAAAALLREESRGAHCRSDFPEAKSELAQRSHLTFAAAIALRQTVSETPE